MSPGVGLVFGSIARCRKRHGGTTYRIVSGVFLDSPHALAHMSLAHSRAHARCNAFLPTSCSFDVCMLPPPSPLFHRGPELVGVVECTAGAGGQLGGEDVDDLGKGGARVRILGPAALHELDEEGRAARWDLEGVGEAAQRDRGEGSGREID